MVFFHYKKTSLNGPMAKVITELKMEKYNSNENMYVYKHTFNPKYPPVVTIL